MTQTKHTVAQMIAAVKQMEAGRDAAGLGSERLAAWTNQTLASEEAYAPFGEAYAGAGAGEQMFTAGLAAVNGVYPANGGANPQTRNAYAYVANQPLTATDPLGLSGNGSTGCGAGIPADGPCPQGPPPPLFVVNVLAVPFWVEANILGVPYCATNPLACMGGPIPQPSSDSGGGGGGGAGSSPITTAPPAGPGCSSALAAAGRGSSLAGVNTADANWAVLASAAGAHGISPQVLAAIGVYESDFADIGQRGGGIGTGVFQNDSPPNPPVQFTGRILADLPGQANAAAALLQTGYNSLVRQGFSPGLAMLGAIRDYNGGGWSLTPTLLEAGPQYLDIGTAGGDYVTNVVGIAAACFGG